MSFGPDYRIAVRVLHQVQKTADIAGVKIHVCIDERHQRSSSLAYPITECEAFANIHRIVKHCDSWGIDAPSFSCGSIGVAIRHHDYFVFGVQGVKLSEEAHEVCIDVPTFAESWYDYRELNCG